MIFPIQETDSTTTPDLAMREREGSLGEGDGSSLLLIPSDLIVFRRDSKAALSMLIFPAWTNEINRGGFIQISTIAANIIDRYECKKENSRLRAHAPDFRLNLDDDTRGRFRALLWPEKTPSQDELVV